MKTLWQQSARVGNAAIAAVLCALMMAPQAVEAAAPAGSAAGSANGGDGAASGERAGIPAESHRAALTQQQKVLMALNRFTFGPRPGDEAAVGRMGLERWFELQLHPERIDDTAFEEQMQAFPAMQLSQAELIQRFPPPPIIRQMETKEVSLPKDPVERAIYADAEASYLAQKKKQEQAAQAGSVPAAAVSPTHDGEAVQNGAPGGGGATSQVSESRPGASPTNGVFGKKGKAGKHQTPVEPMTEEQVEAVLALGPEQRFGDLVAMPAEEAVSLGRALRPVQRLALVQGFTPQQREAVEAMQSPERVVSDEVMETRVLRDIESQRQLQAVMTDFWLNHFSVYIHKNENEPYYLPAYEREAILPNALGKFEDLLVATAFSPAMLMYLDNWESIGPKSVAAEQAKFRQEMNPQAAGKTPEGINENYGRELMELHTLGVNGGYTQKDVIEVAKCFTGWTIMRPYGGRLQPNSPDAQGEMMVLRGRRADGSKEPMAAAAAPGSFVFMENRHEPGNKVVLGQTIHEGGIKEGLEVLHILATSPATAHHISEQLAERFVSDTPPPALVDRMAATFLKSDGDIKAVLLTMFHSPEFWAPKNYRAKVKTPVEFLASAVRASDATVTDPLPLVQAMNRLGMPVYGMQTPNGYSWTADAWVSSNALISRMNFALVLSGGRVPGTVTNWPALLEPVDLGSGEDNWVASEPSPADEQRLEMLLLGQPAAPRTRAAVLAEFGDPTAQRQAEASFNARPMRPEDGGVVRASFGRNGARGRGQPETPLDTMAGLLLGSPDFQRR